MVRTSRGSVRQQTMASRALIPRRAGGRIHWLLAVLILMQATVLAIKPPQRGDLQNFDKRKPDSAAASRNGNGVPFAAKPGRRAAAERLRSRLRDLDIDEDPIVGTPKLVRTRRGFLTGPNGGGDAISASALATVAAGDKHRVIKAFLNEHSALFGHDATALNSARVRKDFLTKHNGLQTVVWEQQLDGIRVFEAVLAAHVTKRGELVSIGSQFVSDPAAFANKGTAGRQAIQAAPPITAQQAISQAAGAIEEDVAAKNVTTVEAPQGPELQQVFSAPGLNEARVSLVWLPMDESTLRLCWEVLLTSKARGEAFRVLVDALTGEALVRHCLTNYISDATYNVYTSDSPSPFSPGHATPSSIQPALVPRTLVTLSAFSPAASPNSWINDGGNETLGNNVDAHTDLDNNDIADTPRPQGSPFRVFNFPLDLTQAPSTYKEASVTQLFYLCNWIHDRYYQLGFDEDAGNFQASNLGHGGNGNDAVQADAQDSAGLAVPNYNNANFSTWPDGIPGRMQMYLFEGPTPDIDGGLDAEIVIHEYTHGLSNRLVGGGVGISALQPSGMGEGWSDFYALSLLAEATDDPNGTYAPGGYATHQLSGLTQNYYYGIRRYPYSTDLTKNPLTFKDIDPGQFSSHPGIPHSPIFGDFPAEVHCQGEVWCAALWEARANLIAKWGHAVGNELILQLVTDGMKLSPANPTFLQARDAIIAADQVKSGGENRLQLWAAFAKRGMGVSAIAPNSSTTTGVTESFVFPDPLAVSPVASVAANGPAAGPFTPVSTTYTLQNTDDAALNWTATAKGGWLKVSQSSGTLAPGATTTVVVSFDALADSLPAGTYSGTVTFTDLATATGLSRSFTLTVGATLSLAELFHATNPNDLDNSSFTFTPDGSATYYHVCKTPATSFPSDPAGGTNVTLPDDSSTKVTLSSGNHIFLYGTAYSDIYIGSNGYLTFTTGDTRYQTTLVDHFDIPRISALFDDLNPAVAGTISFKQLPDRFVATYQNVPQYNTTNQNSFQFELFFDGRIRVTFLAIADTRGLMGLSRGLGIPAGFSNTDFSAFQVCGTELPGLAVTVPATASEGAGTLTGQGMISIPATLAFPLTVSLTSSDTSEATVPAQVTIEAGNTSASFDLSLVNDSIADGTRTVRIEAFAVGYLSGTRAITVTDDETETLTVAAPTSAHEGDGVLAGQGSASLGAPAAESLMVGLSSSDPTELQVPPFVIIPAGDSAATFDLTVVDDTAPDGPQNAVITASVANWPAGTTSMQVLDNDPVIVTVTATDSNTAEGANPGTFTIIRVDDLSRPLTVSYALSGTASNGSDYATLSGSAVIPVNAVSTTVTITPIADDIMEGPETAILTIQPNATYQVGSPGTATVLIGPDAGPGNGILREWWLGITGTAVSALTSNAAYPNNPSGSVIVTNLFQAPASFADNYGTRMRGYFIPPATGSYTFYIASDDQSQLFLSTDSSPANAAKIAEVTGFTTSQQWNKYASQKSAAQPLAGGEWYYIEVLHKEGTGGDNLAVGVEMPEGYLERPILGNRLQPWGTSKPVVTISATDAVAGETGINTGAFQITRSGPTIAPLLVTFARGGSATSGLDYAPIAGPVVIILPGLANSKITILPIPDLLSEGDETVSLTLQPSAGYTVGAASTATVTIKDKPGDEWRFLQFGGNVPLSEDADDFDGDGIINLLERALNLDPKTSTVASLPAPFIEDGHLALTYTRLKNAPDLLYTPEVADSPSGPWLSGPEEITESVIAEDALTETVQAVDAQPIDENTNLRFMRLRLDLLGP